MAKLGNASEAKFLDYVEYNQDQYADAAAQYTDNHIISGLEINVVELSDFDQVFVKPGSIFFNGWQIKFNAQMTTFLTETDKHIYLRRKSQLGDKQPGIYSDSYTPGSDLSYLDISNEPTLSGYESLLIFEDKGEGFEVVLNGRLDSVNGKKATQDNNLTLKGADILATSPLDNMEEDIDTVFADLNTKINTLTGLDLADYLTEVQSDQKYKHQYNIFDNFTDSEFEYMDLYGILNAVLSKIGSEGMGGSAFTIYAEASATNTSFNAAVKTLLEEQYNFVSDNPCNLVWECNPVSFETENELTIIEPIAGIYKFTTGNYGGSGTYSNFKPFQINVGAVVQQNPLSTKASREKLLYQGAYYLYADQFLRLTIDPYTLDQFEEFVFTFQQAESAVPNGKGYVNVTIRNFTKKPAALYGEYTMLSVNDYTTATPDLIYKGWFIRESDGYVVGTGINSNTNKGYVLTSVIGYIDERYYKPTLTRSTNRSNSILDALDTIPTSELSPDVEGVILASPTEAYDIYNLTDEELERVKKAVDELSWDSLI